MILRPKPSLRHGALSGVTAVAPIMAVPAWLRRAIPDAQTLAGKEVEDVALAAGSRIRLVPERPVGRNERYSQRLRPLALHGRDVFRIFLDVGVFDEDESTAWIPCCYSSNNVTAPFWADRRTPCSNTIILRACRGALLALNIGLLIMAGVALLANIPAGRLPNCRPGNSADTKGGEGVRR